MPGFSNDLNSRFNKTWGLNMTGGGSGNLANKRHSVVIPKSNTKSKKRKTKRKESRPRKSRKY